MIRPSALSLLMVDFEIRLPWLVIRFTCCMIVSEIKSVTFRLHESDQVHRGMFGGHWDNFKKPEIMGG